MNKYKRIFDISLPIYEGMATYPLNPEVEFKSLKTRTSTISKITFGSHTGTHIDFPRHVLRRGKRSSKFSLETFIGACRVLDLTNVKRSIGREDLEKQKIKEGDRVLVKTRNSIRGFRSFYPDYVFLDPDGAAYLAHKKIKLFGIDSLSVKEKGSLDNRPHTELLKRNIPIIEGLNLKLVKRGSYVLVSLPLRLGVEDGSPARVILLR